MVFYGIEKEVRQKILLSEHNLKCTCKACTEGWGIHVHSCDRFKPFLQFRKRLHKDFGLKTLEDFRTNASKIPNTTEFYNKVLHFNSLFNWFFGVKDQF